MEILVLWLISGIIGAAILSSSNKAGCGCLLGILLGPIGWILAFLMRDTKEKEAKREKEQREFHERECPHCAERILRKANVCKHCGRDVPPVK